MAHITLTDDGTMDTVLRCSDCGQEFRFNYAFSVGDELAPDNDMEAEDAYNDYVTECILEVQDEHSCETEPDGPTEDDITTTDHETFYQYGKVVLTAKTPITGTWAYRDDATRELRYLGTFTGCETALRAYMERVQFWPAVYFVSDHGNAHLIDLG